MQNAIETQEVLKRIVQFITNEKWKLWKIEYNQNNELEKINNDYLVTISSFWLFILYVRGL